MIQQSNDTKNNEELTLTLSPFVALVLVKFLDTHVPKTSSDGWKITQNAAIEFEKQVRQKITKDQVDDATAELEVSLLLKKIPNIAK